MNTKGIVKFSIVIFLILITIISVSFFTQGVEAQESEPELSYNKIIGQKYGNEITIESQTYIDEYISWAFTELTNDEWEAEFEFVEPFWSDTKECLMTPEDNICWEELEDSYFSEYSLIKMRTDLLNLSNYPLVNLTSNIAFEEFEIDLIDGKGKFKIKFPEGFKGGERAQFGFETTIIDTSSLPFFYPTTRNICRDESGIIHVIYKKMSYVINYANSSDNGMTWNINTSFYGASSTSTSSKSWPHISSWSWDNPITSDVSNDVIVERRGEKIYVIYGASTAIVFYNSSDGGQTWGSTTNIISGSYDMPNFAVNGTGGANDILYVVYRGLTGATVYFTNSTDSGASWGSSESLMSQYYSYPQITFSGDNVFVVARERGAVNTDYQVWYTNSTNKGEDWTTAYRIDTTGGTGTAYYGVITVDPNGNPYVFWNENTAVEGDNAVFRNNSGGWGNVRYITNDSITPTGYVQTKYNSNNNKIEFIWWRGGNLVYSYFDFSGAPNIPGYPAMSPQKPATFSTVNCSSLYNGADGGRVDFIWYLQNTTGEYLMDSYNGSDDNEGGGLSDLERAWTNVTISTPSRGNWTCSARAYNGTDYSSWINSTKTPVGIVYDCSELDVADETYLQINDITDSSTSYCIDITANNITLDCQGYTIDGNDAADYAIRIARDTDTETNITIKNCVLKQWDTNAVYSDGESFNVTMNNITIYDVPDDGISCDGDGFVLNNSNITCGDDGSVSLGCLSTTANDFIIENTIIYGSPEDGIWMTNNYGHNIIKDSNITDNNYFDIRFFPLVGCNFDFDNVLGTDDKPIYFINDSGAGDKTIQHWNDNVSQIIVCDASNVVMNNITLKERSIRNNGIHLVASDYITIENSSISGQEYSVYIRNTHHVNMSWNTFNYSDSIGVYQVGADSDYNYIDNNSFIDCDSTSVDISAGNNNYLRNNTFRTNNQYSIDLAGSLNYAYNNLFNDSVGTYITATGTNYFNTTKQTGTRVYGNGTLIGGNYYTNSTGDAYSDTCDDTNYDGICDSSFSENGATDYLPLSDEYNSSNDAPIWSLNSTNASEIVGETTEYRVYWEDDDYLYSLGGYIFSFDNCTGTLSNETWVEMTGTGNWSNVTKENICPGGGTVQWKVYANDTFNVWNSTDTWEYIAADFPTWSLNSTNGTCAGCAISHNTYWEANSGTLSGYIFSFHNGTNWTQTNESSDQESGEIQYKGSLGAGIDIYDDFETNWGNWSNVTYDDEEWYRGTSTPSGGTGPQSGGVGGSGTYFVYVETSSGYCYDAGEEAIIESESINWDDGTNDNVSWYTNFYGGDIGTMYLEENTTGSWVELWSLSGDDGNSGTVWTYWSNDTSSLTGTGYLRFRYVCVGGYQGDAAIDRINISAVGTLSEEANGTYTTYDNVLSGSLYEVINNITVTINVSVYNNSGSLNNSNSNPDLWLEIYNGSDWIEIGNMSITGTGNFSNSTQDSTVLSGWQTDANRDTRIKGRYLDYNQTEEWYDEINYTDVWVSIDSEQEMLNDTWVAWGGSPTEAWSNVTKTVNDTTGVTIKWKFYANTSYLWNATDTFEYTTVSANLEPYWSNNQSDTPSIYDSTYLAEFNITWEDAETSPDVVFIEQNWTNPSGENLTMTNDTYGGSIYNYSVILPAGTYYWKSYANDTANLWNSTDIWTFIIGKARPVIVLSNNSSSVNTSDLVGSWNFDNNVLDNSGYDNNGTRYNFSDGWVTGKYGNALEFNATNETFIDCGNDSSLNFGENDFSIEFWIKVTDTTVKSFLYKLTNGDYPGWDISLYTDTGKVYFWGGNQNDPINLFSNTAVNDGAWHHIVVIRNSSSFQVYVDGSNDTSDSSEILAVTHDFDSTWNLSIGDDNGADDGFFNGTIDNIRIWNRSLSAGEIKILYESSVTYPTETNFSYSESNEGDSDLTYNFYRNQTSKTTPDSLTLGGGYYYYLVNTSGGENYTKRELLIPLIVNKGVTSINLTFNGNRKSVSLPQYVNIVFEAKLNVSDKTISLNSSWNKWTNISDTTPISNTTTMTDIGIFTFNASFDGDLNYTGDFESWTVYITAPTAAGGWPENITNITDVTLICEEDMEICLNDTIQLCVNGTEWFMVEDCSLQNRTCVYDVSLATYKPHCLRLPAEKKEAIDYFFEYLLYIIAVPTIVAVPIVFVVGREKYKKWKERRKKRKEKL